MRYLPAILLGLAFIFTPSTTRADLILTEVLYDVTSTDTDQEWIEIYNTGAAPVDLADWSIGWGGLDYTYSVIQLSGNVAAGETFVVGGPISNANNAFPVFDQPQSFANGIQNSGELADGVALFNVPAADVTAATVPTDAVIYGDMNTNDLIDESGAVGGVDVGDALSGSSIARLTVAGAWAIRSEPNPNFFAEATSGHVVLSEVLYNVSGADSQNEWIEIYNAGSTTVDLAGWSIGHGGLDYTFGILQLAGTLAPGQVFVVGGPLSGENNFNPIFDQAIEFAPALQNAGLDADGIALFNVPAIAVTASTVPVDAVIYGDTANSNGLIDETGTANPPDVGDAPAGSIERVDLAGTWAIQASPTPNTTALVLPPLNGFTRVPLRITGVGPAVSLEIVSTTAGPTMIAYSQTLGSGEWIAAVTVEAVAGTTPVTISFPGGTLPSAGFFLALAAP